MTFCQRCHKFLLFKTANGYCKKCDALFAQEMLDLEYRQRLEQQHEGKLQQIKENQQDIIEGQVMCNSAVQQPVGDNSLQPEATQQCTDISASETENYTDNRQWMAKNPQESTATQCCNTEQHNSPCEDCITLDRKKVMSQVLEYWYTLDFLKQGDFETETTFKSKETYTYALNNPFRFSVLYRHMVLNQGEDILSQIKSEESTIEQKRLQECKKENKKTVAPCCHGRITVYLGSASRSILSDRIAELLNCEAPANPSPSRFALASFQLDYEGTFIHNSLSLSPIVWAAKRILERKPDMTMYQVLDPKEYKKAQKTFEPIQREHWSSFKKISILARRIFNETYKPVFGDSRENAEGTADIHYCFFIYRNQKELFKREEDSSNSLAMNFYADDLAKFRQVVDNDKWFDNPMWKTLSDYICAPYNMSQGIQRELKDMSINAVRDPSSFFQTKQLLSEALSIDNTPWGKWPSKYQPFLMQQVAINLSLHSEDAIFAVNGPPGTGKTSLLKEIVADRVVQKAMILAAYESPDSMFEKNSGCNGRFDYYSFQPQAMELRKLSLVVASSNNAAVENISKQLPLAAQLDKNLYNTGDVHVDEIQKMFSLEHADREIVSRKKFDEQRYEDTSLPDIYFSSYATDLLRDTCWGLICAPLGKRSNVVSFYKNVLNKLKWDIINSKKNYGQHRLPRYQIARKRFLAQLETVKYLRNKLKTDIEQAELANADSIGQSDEYALCLSDALVKDLASADLQTRKAAQMSCPRISKQYDREREKLFHEALLLTKEFILSSQCCIHNLNLLGNAWGLENEDRIFNVLIPSDKENALYQIMPHLVWTLQLLVPVISTTFASAGHFFKYVRKADALGTIIVDEAGQATPQMALTLFSKASKAIIVGDPNQITPVVADEFSFLASNLDQEIGKAYSDPSISVQKIADYISSYGGTQQDSFPLCKGKRIGVPLYVHSRCLDPMFSISNRLSYDDAMLSITREPGPIIKESFCFQTSQWINVCGYEEKRKNHFIRNQGIRVLELLNAAFEKNEHKEDQAMQKAGPDLFVISPFSTTAEEMKHLLKRSLNGQYPALARNATIVENWIADKNNPHIGTVHTFQGKEANEVILLLGCDVASKNSTKWVNRNIINVAVSRAKYRLYVIGDFKVWEDCDPVVEMKRSLDTFALYTFVEQCQASTQAMDIPELPSFEMFESSEPDENIENLDDINLPVDTSTAIFTVTKHVSNFSNGFSPKELAPFNIADMNDYTTRFSPIIQEQLKIGILLYNMLKPKADYLPQQYDVSFIAISFCKAFELSLKQKILPGLLLLVPGASLKGSILSEANTDLMTIGEFSTIISRQQAKLGLIMARLGYEQYDRNWWGAFLQKLRLCKDCRNECCHPGKPYTWAKLEEMIRLLFHDSIVEKCESVSVPTEACGLLLENSFYEAIQTVLASDNGPNKIEKARLSLNRNESYAQSSSIQSEAFVTKFCRIYSRIRKCTIDGTGLVQRNVGVRRRNGLKKHMTMLYCQNCGRYYMNPDSLSHTINLLDYDLTPIQFKNWAQEMYYDNSSEKLEVPYAKKATDTVTRI